MASGTYNKNEFPSRLLVNSKQRILLFVLIYSVSLSIGGGNENGLFVQAWMPPPNHHQAAYHRKSVLCLSESTVDEAARQALERTAQQLARLQSTSSTGTNDNSIDDVLAPDPLGRQKQLLAREYLQQPANALKVELKMRGLRTKGRKPDLAQRLAADDLEREYGPQEEDGKTLVTAEMEKKSDWADVADDAVVVPRKPVTHFCGLRLSQAASEALTQAGFDTPSPIQAQAIPAMVHSQSGSGESCILHAETGSGKTLAYLLPWTEALWQEYHMADEQRDDDNPSFVVVLTPTRELAAQVAGIASVLAPPGMVRLVSRPMNLMAADSREANRSTVPRLVVGSAKAVLQSLYGSNELPCPPTSKPEAMFFLRHVGCVILDEVDRLLLSAAAGRKGGKKHEKPAAVITSAVQRLSLGSQVVAASATVGRPLKRELARVMGLTPQECPRVLRGSDSNRAEHDDNDADHNETTMSTNRAVTIPDTVKNYVLPIEDGASGGRLLTATYDILQRLTENDDTTNRRILMVLTRGFGMNTQNVIGALRHFGCQPSPISLLDALEGDGGNSEKDTDRMQIHRQVSGASGVGQSADSTYFESDNNDSEGYLLVTGEDTVRGLHMDSLDVVLVVGRPKGPDEYTHIAGRTGRAGRPGKSLIVAGLEDATLVQSWEKMLGVRFETLELAQVNDLD